MSYRRGNPKLEVHGNRYLALLGVPCFFLAFLQS